MKNKHLTKFFNKNSFKFCTNNTYSLNYDKSQVQSFNDQLILVDFDDNVVKPISKINGFFLILN